MVATGMHGTGMDDTGMVATGMHRASMVATGMDGTGMVATGMHSTGMIATGMHGTGMVATSVGRPPQGQGLLLVLQQRRLVQSRSSGLLARAVHNCAAALAAAKLARASSLPVQASARCPEGMELRCLVHEELLHLCLLLWAAAR